MRWLALLLGVCSGCDSVLGFDTNPGPCSSASFANAKPTTVMTAEQFSISWDQTRAVVVQRGSTWEVSPLTAKPVAIDIGPYFPMSLGLSPEGDSLLFTAALEPPTLTAVVGGNGTWRQDPNVPVGTFAGTPSADAFGPRRVLVHMRPGGQLQEYEDDGGLWKTVGDGHDFNGPQSANLTPNGLTMVYTAPQDDGTSAVVLATRTSTAGWFGTPVVILAGDHQQPQLLGQCNSLFVLDPNTDPAGQDSLVARYDH
jgi:hypothetical protein